MSGRVTTEGVHHTHVLVPAGEWCERGYFLETGPRGVPSGPAESGVGGVTSGRGVRGTCDTGRNVPTAVDSPPLDNVTYRISF